MVIGIRSHVGKCELLLLRLVRIQFQRIGRPAVRHHCLHAPAEERSAAEHQMRENRLICRAIAELRVLGKHIVDECSSAAPMPNDEDRVLDTLNGREIFRHPVIDLIHWCKYRRHEFGKTIFRLVFLIDFLSAVSHFVECPETGSHKGVDR